MIYAFVKLLEEPLVINRLSCHPRGYHYKQFEQSFIVYIDLFHASHHFKHAFAISVKYAARHDALNGRLLPCEGHNCIEERGAAIEVQLERRA